MRYWLLFLIIISSINPLLAASSHDRPLFEKQPHIETFVPPKKVKRRIKIKKILKNLRVIIGVGIGILLLRLGLLFIKFLLSATGSGLWFFLLDLGIILLAAYILVIIMIITVVISGGQLGCRYQPTPYYYYH